MSLDNRRPKIDFLAIIQARIGSTRFPNKVMQTVGGIPMVKRVWLAALGSWADKVVVAWPERYPDLDENDVLGRFQRLCAEFQPRAIIRLTSDCPLLTSTDINAAIMKFNTSTANYYSNHWDGHDVQIFYPWMMNHKEHVIADFTTPSTGLSVNTKEDLERVRQLAR